MNIQSFLIVLLLPLFCLLKNPVQAQVPSILNGKDSSKVFVSGYLAPFVQYYTIDPGLGLNVSPGISIGYTFSKRFHLQTGLEFTSVFRNVDESNWGGNTYFYKSLFYEIPLEARFKLAADKENIQQLFITAGTGFQFSWISASDDPYIITNKLYFHQLFIRAGFEHQIGGNRAFSWVWGLNSKANPLTALGEEFSIITGNFTLGAKFGVLFGL